jgi:hypothetical protein
VGVSVRPAEKESTVVDFPGKKSRPVSYNNLKKGQNKAEPFFMAANEEASMPSMDGHIRCLGFRKLDCQNGSYHEL